MNRAGPVGVAIATRDRRDSLLRTLGRLAELPERPPVIVVDNDSSDGTVGAVARAYPEVEVIRLRENLGASARNLAVARLATPLVALCDDDSWWDPGSLDLAAECFADPRLGLLAAQIVVGRERAIDPVSREMDGPRPLGLPGPRVHGFVACGAVVRREAFLAVGGFCERFLIGGEERLLAIDLRLAGWELCYVEGVHAVHVPDAAGRLDRGWLRRRNDLWTAWLRAPAAAALLATARAGLDAAHGPEARRALAGALRHLPWALAERRRRPRRMPRPVDRERRPTGTPGDS